jgi:hypothetical protein
MRKIIVTICGLLSLMQISASDNFKQVELSEAGTLAQCLGDEINDIDSLVVAGPVNEADFSTMWSASYYGKLEVINLEKAQIADNKLPKMAFFNPSVQYVESAPWTYLTMLRRVILPEGLEEIGEAAFFLTLIEQVELPSTVRKIDARAFAYTPNFKMERFVIPEGVTEIPTQCFRNSFGIAEFVLPSTLKTIGQGAFIETRMSHINFPDGLEQIGQLAFYGSDQLQEAILPNGCLKIEDSAFYHCESMQRFRFPASLKVIPRETLAYCYKLHDVILPDSLTAISPSAFEYCPDLHEVSLPEGLTSIGASAFSRCSLDSLVLPTTLTHIAATAFYQALNCDEVYVKAPNPPTCEETSGGPFEGCETRTLYVARSASEKYRNAAVWSGFSNIVEIDYPELAALEGVRAAEPMSFEATNGGLRISGNGAYAIYSTDGRLVGGGACSEAATVDLAPGIYVVRTAVATTKVAVK